MEALGNIFGKIIGGMGSQTGQGIGGLFGMGSNILQQIMKWRAMSQANTQAKNLQRLVNNPSLLSARIASAAQPLDQNLTRTVTDSTLANLANRGLNPQTASGVTQQAVAQAVAPYEQQNLQTAAQLIASTLGLPMEAALQLAQIWSGQSGTDTSSIWANLAKEGFNPSVGGTPDPSLGTISAIPSISGRDTGGDVPPPDITLPTPTFPDLPDTSSQPQQPLFWDDAWKSALPAPA